MSKVSSISVARERKERLEAYHIGESVISIFEEVFGSSMMLRSALAGARDCAENVKHRAPLAQHRKLVQTVIDEVVSAAVNTDGKTAWSLHPGVMAAYCVLECLADNVNLKEVQRRANEAFKYAPEKKA